MGRISSSAFNHMLSENIVEPIVVEGTQTMCIDRNPIAIFPDGSWCKNLLVLPIAC